MTEQDVRQKIAEIDEKRQRARVLEDMSRWPMFTPSSVSVDRKRGLFRWFGSVSGESLYVELTRDERHEFREWMLAKAARLDAEASAVSAALGSEESS